LVLPIEPEQRLRPSRGQIAASCLKVTPVVCRIDRHSFPSSGSVAAAGVAEARAQTRMPTLKMARTTRRRAMAPH
jgi:hypothetical protein